MASAARQPTGVSNARRVSSSLPRLSSPKGAGCRGCFQYDDLHPRFKQARTGGQEPGWPLSYQSHQTDAIDFHILNFTALSVVGVLQYSLLPLALWNLICVSLYVAGSRLPASLRSCFLFAKPVDWVSVDWNFQNSLYSDSISPL